MSQRVPILIATSIVIMVALLALSGVNPAEAGLGLVRGAFGNPVAIRGTLKQTMPLLFAGMAVFLALRAGLFNIGAEGQLLVGALAAATVALRVPGPAGIGLAILVGMLAGALWTLPAGLIKAYKGGHEVITTIMLNNIAGLLTTALVSGPLKDPGNEMPSTPSLVFGTRVPSLLVLHPRDGGSVLRFMAPDDPAVREIGRIGFELNLGLVAGIVMILGLGVWLYRTVAGYELRATGENAVAARFAGVDTKAVTVRALAVSGALAGLGGALVVLTQEGRFYAGFSPGYGFDALGVAILAGSAPWGIVPAALAFGALNKGALAIQVLDVPKGVTGVILGVLIVAFAAARYRERRSDG